MHFIRSLSRHLKKRRIAGTDLDYQWIALAKHAQELADCGVKRINVSIDTLDPEKFRKVTRWGELARVLEGVDAAQKAGLHIKINAVALKGFNDQEIPSLMRCTRSRMDLTLIETMPMGEIDEDRTDQYLPLSLVRASLESEFTLAESSHRTGGPARYVTVKETGGSSRFHYAAHP